MPSCMTRSPGEAATGLTDRSLRSGMWRQVPKVGAHLEREGVHATMFCSHWFITLFAYTLPFDHLLRVWDVLFLEGPKIIFR